MEENAKYFIVDSESGQKVNTKPLPLKEAEELMGRKLTESAGEKKYVLKQYLLG